MRTYLLFLNNGLKHVHLFLVVFSDDSHTFRLVTLRLIIVIIFVVITFLVVLIAAALVTFRDDNLRALETDVAIELVQW